MRSFVEICAAAPSFALQRQTLRRVIAEPSAHARFLNTLARLEYVGVRKILKARPASELDLEGLQHILEEAVHATRLKKFALNVAPTADLVATFGEEHTLEGDAAEAYFQAIDARAAELSQGAPTDTCYCLTSTVIEVRATCFYPAYQQLLGEMGQRISVASIIQDEDQHLQKMGDKLPSRLATWRAALTQLMQVEERGYAAFLERVNARLDAEDLRASTSRDASARGDAQHPS